MENLTAACLIRKLITIISKVGFFKIVVTDNGPPFCSSEFSEFCKENNMQLTQSPPYHPQSNGLVERAVQKVKKVLKKVVYDNASEIE
jgi:transposase InsO family protein